MASIGRKQNIQEKRNKKKETREKEVTNEPRAGGSNIKSASNFPNPILQLRETNSRV